ncbi:reverse transcriptase family protein [Methylobacter sp. BlB1]|uniref:reverse transcriptase family protein n=1 Tax=Methylobacter sp. BlB1 TaxID=2785914 RepID=UPI0018938E3D|nr:reverse transcriptase family protein [Methylobacter sp. BlB1]MBF6648035.1 RNA-directed DNA polymerase [Methylobacter sp. BlB1]
MLKKPTKRKRKCLKRYSIDQCSLYKVRSAKRLSEILGVEKQRLDSILKSSAKYREFTIEETTNPFSSKFIKSRQVQAPSDELRRIHERILYLLEPIELPNYAHAAVKGRSYRSNAATHVNSARMATFDLKNFYGSTQRYLVYSFFLDNLKCSPDIAGKLTELTTFRNALPTGSPLSPLLSLHAAKPMLDELSKLAQLHDLIFTCYIDDLTFSGKKIPRSLERRVSRIVGKYNHQLSIHKTKIFDEDKPKHVTGVVINKGKLAVPHSRFLTARKLELAIAGKFPMHGNSMLKLCEKLAGLLGETACIDPTYKKWAEKAQEDLRKARTKDSSIVGPDSTDFGSCQQID